MALPGLVIALGLVSFSVRYALRLYQSSLELIVAYAILFLPLARRRRSRGDGAGPPRLEDIARSLGRRPTARLAAGHAAADRARPRGRVRARVHLLRDRADGHAAAAPDRREHARDAVLGLHERLLLRRSRAVRGADGRDLGRSRLPAQPPHERRAATGCAADEQADRQRAVEGLRPDRGAARRRARGAGGLAHRGARPLRLRQDDAAAGDRGLRARRARACDARRAHARRRAHVPRRRSSAGSATCRRKARCSRI